MPREFAVSRTPSNLRLALNEAAVTCHPVQGVALHNPNFLAVSSSESRMNILLRPRLCLRTKPNKNLAIQTIRLYPIYGDNNASWDPLVDTISTVQYSVV